MPDQILDGIQQQFASATAGWYASIFPYARKLFFALAVIELTWAATLWALERDDTTSVASAFLRKVVATAFFYAILLNAGSWIPATINSFAAIGASAGGLEELTPSGVLTQGINVAAKMLEPLGLLGFVTATIAAIIGGLSAIGVIVAYGVIAAQLLLTNVESYIVVGGGILMLGFAGARWTSEIASRYLSYAIAIGIKLFTLYLIIGIGNSLAPQWGALLASPDATLNPRVYFQILGGALAYMMLAWYIPSLGASLYSGTVALSVAELAHTGRSAGTFGAAAALGGLASGGATIESGRAIAEATRLGRASADAHGGGLYGAVTGTFDAAGALARESVRGAVPTLSGSHRRVSGRLAEERALRSARVAGYGRSDSSGPRDGRRGDETRTQRPWDAAR